MSLDAAIAANEQALARLSGIELRMLGPILRKMRDDLTRVLRDYDGDGTYSIARQRAALLQLQKVVKQIERTAPQALGQDLVRGGETAIRGGIRGLRKMVEEANKQYGGIATSLRLDVAAVLADQRRTMIGRAKHTAAVFGARVSRDIRRDIMTGIVRGESVDQITNRVMRHKMGHVKGGIPRGARDVRDGMETTIDARKIADRMVWTREDEKGHGPFGQGEGKLKQAKEIMSKGVQRDPVKLAISPNGRIDVIDGRHRLLAAMELGVPVRVKWVRGAVEMDPEGERQQKKQIGQVVDRPFSSARSSAERIVRTELVNAYNSAQLADLEAMDAEDTGYMKQWDAANDRRVCILCHSLDEEVVALNENFSGGVPHPPRHPHCRCAIKPWRKEWGGKARPRATKSDEREPEPKAKPLPKKAPPPNAPKSTMTPEEYRATHRSRSSDQDLRTFGFRVVTDSKAPVTEDVARARAQHPKLWATRAEGDFEQSKHKTRAQAEASMRRLSRYGIVSRIVRVEVEN